MLSTVYNNPWVKAIGVLLALIVLVFLLYILSPVLIPLMFAFLVAYVFDPVVDYFEAKNISRSVSIACLAIVGIALLLAIPLFLIPTMITQADNLATAAKKGFEDGLIKDSINRLPLHSMVESLGVVNEDGVPYEGNEYEDPLGVLISHISLTVREQGLQILSSQKDNIVSFGGSAGSQVVGFFSTITNGIMGVILFLGNLAIFSFVTVYLLKDFDTNIATAQELLPGKYKSKIVEITQKVDSQVRSFLRGQMAVCVCLGVMYAIGLSIAGVPFALLIALFGMFASFIPYLGLVLTIGPAVGLCLAQQGGITWHVGAVIATFVIAQMLEGTVLTPKIVGDQVGLGPVWVILAIMVFGNFLGFLGLLLAVPIAASLKVLVEEGLAYYRASSVFNET
jgi:predicted PurR-regulated permease PerM